MLRVSWRWSYRKTRAKISPVNRENRGAADWGPLQACWQDPAQCPFGRGPAEQEERAAREHKTMPVSHLGTPVCWRRFWEFTVRKDSCIQQTEGSECCLYSRECQDAQEKVFFLYIYTTISCGNRSENRFFSLLQAWAANFLFCTCKNKEEGGKKESHKKKCLHRFWWKHFKATHL